MRLFYQSGVFLRKTILQNVNYTSDLMKSFSYLGNWESPQGHDTGITVYNSAINKKVPLKLKRKSIATWYICGPTVYDESHIGHASCYVKFDIIKRIMESIFNINIISLIGITDIDDKIIKRSLETGISISQIAKKYEFEFFNDMEAMQVKRPFVISRVTENIPLIIDFIIKLIDKDFAYVTDEGNVYFVVSKSASADVFNDIPDDPQVIVDPLKRDKRDFALWKKSKPGEPFWLSPWGEGRPGWHIECSAMASSIFGCQFDIHSGGFDLLFPHHTNEKSQSEAFHGCSQWVNYWLHSGLLQVGSEEKMSKSVKNTVTIKDYLKNNNVNDFRFLCLQSLYRKNISYCTETIEGAKGLHDKLHNFINECELYIADKLRISPEIEELLYFKLEKTKEKIVSFLSDDFNTSQALFCLNDLVDEVNKALQASNASSSSAQSVTSVAVCLNYVNHMLEIFGVRIMCKKRLKREFINFVDKVVQFRNEMRLFALCHSEKGNGSPTKFIQESYADVEAAYLHVLNSEIFSENIQGMKVNADQMYKESLKCVFSLPNNNLVQSDRKIINEERKRRAFILELCDNLRSSLQSHGLAIKDRKDSSRWYPMINLKMECS